MTRPLISIVSIVLLLASTGCLQSSEPVEIDDATAPPSTVQPATTVPTSDRVPTPTTAAPRAEWAPVEPCTVSDLLVPSCGAWLGATTPSREAPVDDAAGLAQYEAAAGNAPDILHFYKRDDASFPTAVEIALSERPGQQRSILFYNWKPNIELSWRDVADGRADGALDTVAAGLRAYPHRLFLTVWHEPEDDLGVAGTAADYVAMYRHVVTRLRELDVTNVVWVMSFTGFGRWADVVDDLYPGDDVVDWIAYDPYGFAEQSNLGEVLNQPGEGWPGFYAWAAKQAPDTPLMLGEWGIDLARQPRAAQILDSGVEYLQIRFPQLKALVYWHDRDPPDGVTVRLDEPTELGRAYAAAYRRFANDPYFNSTDPGLAP